MVSACRISAGSCLFFPNYNKKGGLKRVSPKESLNIKHRVGCNNTLHSMVLIDVLRPNE